MSSERSPLINSAPAPLIEPERYELHSAPLHHFEIHRRDFVKIFGAGIAVFLVTKDSLAQQQGESGGGRGRGGFSGEQMPKEISAWLHVGENGAVTVYTGKVEMGQNIRTSLAQAVAEELRAPFDSISLIMGDTQLTPYDMGTFGSRSTPQMGTQLRRVSSAACDILVDLAAKQWNVERSRLVAKNGEVTDPVARRSLKYGDLAKGQALAQAIPDTDPLVPVADWIVSGKSLPKVDGREFVTGGHKYTSDLKLPGMLHGKVLRPPSFGATLASIDLSAAQAIPAVICVHDGDFVGVAAPDVPTAEKALAAIHAEWKETPSPVTSANVHEYLKANPQTGGRGGGEGGGNQRPSGTGNIDQGLAAANHKLDATYTVAYIAHAPLEPRAAVAQWEGGKLTVHTGSQRPFGVRDELVNAFHLDESSVRVLIPDTGSAYGGKHTGECAVEAARIAKAAGKPVKLIWTREEEFTWAYFRPAGVMEIRSGVGDDGKLTAWEFHNYNSGPSAMNAPYAVANKLEQFHPTQYPLRQGSYRALAATANMFARESHMDDLARAANIDPLEFRLKNLPGDDSGKRIRDVLLAATKSFGWNTRKKGAAGIGYGLACGTEKNGFIATCAEISLDRADGSVKIARVVTAFDCGAVVNPDGLRNQIAGSNVMGLGGALFEAIQFSNGKIDNPKFSKYRVPRFKDVGLMEVVLVDRKDIPSAGAGETPLMALAPAIGNAICDATGTRLRSLPLIPSGLKAQSS